MALKTHPLDRFVSHIMPDVIEQPLMQFARQQEKRGFGGILEMATPLGFLAAPFIPNTKPNSSQVSNLGKNYRGEELALSAAARAAAGSSAGGGIGGGNMASYVPQSTTFASIDTPIQRAEIQERSRVAQMTEQDPLFKKYRVAELTKAYNTASPEDKEKIGLEIWATTNPQLAQKLKPGQLGYTQATSAVMSQSPLGQFQAQTGDMQYANKMDQVPGAMVGFQPQTPLTGIPTPTVPQFGASEVFAKSTPIPGATEMFTDPRKFLSQEELSQTQLALLKKAFESRIK